MVSRQQRDRLLSNACMAVLLLPLLVSCGANDEAVETPLPLATLPGVYTGTFPCDGCPGVPTTIWLRGDAVYFLEQRYSTEGAPRSIASLGRWAWSAETRELTLRGAGPARRFTRPDADSLRLETPSPLEHRVTRSRSLGPFSGSIRLEGMVQPSADGDRFIECVTGMQVPLQRGLDYRSFARQYRHTGGGGKPVFVEFDGQFRWHDDRSIAGVAMETFSTIRTDGRCPSQP